jgi:hypothetical protein
MPTESELEGAAQAAMRLALNTSALLNMRDDPEVTLARASVVQSQVMLVGMIRREQAELRQRQQFLTSAQHP